ncbi:hypothetical protein VTI74DRAFT_214 [Chaetomium olivicolor]
MTDSTSTPAPADPASPARVNTGGSASPSAVAGSPTISPAQAVTPGPASPSAAAGSPGASPGATSPTTTAAPANTGILEADDNPDNPDNDEDSAVGMPTDFSDTTSIRSYIFKYREQNGRTYHAFKEGGEYKPYFLPNDEPENERLDLQHNLFMITQDNNLFTCPHVREKPPKRVLDAGCGTGIWALDFGDGYPESWVVGIDISAIQPNMVSPNVEFVIDDLEADWTFVQPFDFIYARFLTGSIKDWPRFFAQSFRHLNPGGWIEAVDIMNPLRCDDGTLPEDSALLKWNRLLLDATVRLGAPVDSVQRYKQQMIDAGFQNVNQIEYKWPTNTWPKDAKHKEIGSWNHVNIMSALNALTMLSFTQALGWSTVEVEVFLVDVRNDLKNKNIHAYWPIWAIYGQKPE